MNTIITYEEAINNGHKFYYTGIPCIRGHIANRYVSSKGCTKCKSSYTTRLTNKYHASSEEEKHIKKLESYKRYNRNNKDKIANKNSNYYQNNKEKILEKKKLDRENNPAKYAEVDSKRKEVIKRATPNWIDNNHKDQINTIYKEARLKTTNEQQFHVDHIVPLRR